MKGVVLLMLGIAFIGAGIFLIRPARAMTGVVDRQLNSLPDTWHDFTDRMHMFGFGIGMFVFAGLTFYGVYVTWFRP